MKNLHLLNHICGPFILTIICFLFINLIATDIHAQDNSNPVIDSLLTRASSETNSVEKVAIWNELSFQYLFVELRKTKIYADSALDLANEIQDNKGIADGESRLGTYYRFLGEYDQAIIHYHRSLDMRKILGNPGDIANMYHNIGNLLDLTARYDSALSMFNQALALYKQESLDADIAGTYNSIAEVYTHKGEYTLALNACMKGLDIRRRLNDIQGLGHSLLNLGTVYTNLKQFDDAYLRYDSALVFFEQIGDLRGQEKVFLNKGVNASKEGEYPRSAEYFKTALELGAQSGNQEERFNLLFNLGGLHIRMEKYLQAREYLLNAVSQAEKTNDYSGLSLAWHNLGEIELEMGRYQRAIDYFHRSLNVSNQLSARLTRGDLYEGIANSYTRLQQYDSANVYFQLFNRVRDTLYHSDRETIALTNRLKLAEKDNKTKQIELQLADVKSSRQNLIILGLIVLIILLAASFYFINKANKDKQQTIITSMEAEHAYEKRIDDMLNEQKDKSVEALLAGQEAERERISLDLHDHLGALLAKLKWNIDSLIEVFPKRSLAQEADFDSVSELIEETIDEVRQISRNMSSGKVKEFGLEKAIQNLIDGFQDTGITFDLSTHNFDKRLNKVIEIHLYRIAQEAIGNALKHSEATEVNISLNRFGDKVNMLIEDNGKGFDPSSKEQHQGIGLINIQTRANTLKAELDIDSSPGRGTSINIDIPLKQD
ncbi:MAG: sensor histidine kinase [Bacteroidota bacterium]